MTEQINTAKPKFNIFKKWWFWVPSGFIVFILLFIWWLISPAAIDPKALVIESGEKLVASGVNQGILQSELDGKGEITNFDCQTLSGIAIRNGGNFYNDSECQPGSSGFIAKRQKSAQTNTITLYPNTPGSIVNCTASIATFTFNNEQTELLSYTFEDGDCFQGAELPISDTTVQNTEELVKYAKTNEYKRVTQP